MFLHSIRLTTLSGRISSFIKQKQNIQSPTSPAEPGDEFLCFVFPHTFTNVPLLVGYGCRPTEEPNQARTN